LKHSSIENGGVAEGDDIWMMLVLPLINDGSSGALTGMGGDKDGCSFRGLFIR
jgi:hypothetical protein